MTFNQIFISKPSLEDIEKLFILIGIKSVKDNRCVYDKNINLNIVPITQYLTENLKKHYLPCKSKIYFKNINYKKVITILRQCLKLYNYSISYKEKYLSV